jgi:hypothetical protein
MSFLVLGGEAFNVPTIPLIANWHTSQANPALNVTRCAVQSEVSADSMGVFISPIVMAIDNVGDPAVKRSLGKVVNWWRK